MTFFRQTPERATALIEFPGCRPLPRAAAFGVRGSWGSAALHPRLYAVARYRGLAWTSSLNDFLCKAVTSRTYASLTNAAVYNVWPGFSRRMY
jgi:hypothetical protein